MREVVFRPSEGVGTDARAPMAIIVVGAPSSMRMPLCSFLCRESSGPCFPVEGRGLVKCGVDDWWRA